MALDASIFARFAQPMRSVADYDLEHENLQGARQGNALRLLALQQGQQKADEYDRGVQRSNALQGLVGGFGADEEANALALVRGGFLKESQDYQESGAKRKKESAEAGYKAAQADKERIAGGLQKFEIIGQLMGGVQDQATYDLARQKAAQVLGPEFAAQISPQYNPAEIAQAQQQAMSVKERLEQEWKAKGYDRELAKDAEIGRHNQANEQTARGQLGVAQANVGLRRQELAEQKSAPRGQFIQTPDGYVLADPRTGAVTPITGPDGKPLQGKAADRAMTEGQAKANLFGTRMSEADKIIADLSAKGVASPSIGQQLTGGEGLSGMIATAVASPQQQQVDQAQRDFINAVLRRESGAAIASSEFQNARKQYFVQPGDSKEVIAQKAKNRQVAIQGMLAEVPESRRTKPQAGGDTYTDAEKEKRYQAWKAKQ
jgi:hypothetical protein